MEGSGQCIQWVVLQQRRGDEGRLTFLGANACVYPLTCQCRRADKQCSDVVSTDCLTGCWSRLFCSVLFTDNGFNDHEELRGKHLKNNKFYLGRKQNNYKIITLELLVTGYQRAYSTGHQCRPPTINKMYNWKLCFNTNTKIQSRIKEIEQCMRKKYNCNNMCYKI